MKEKRIAKQQIDLFKDVRKLAYGGDLRKKANNRGERPLLISRKSGAGSMHLVLRSTLAKGANSFLHLKNRKKIEKFVKTFSQQKHIQVLKMANVGNHIHLHIRIRSRELYKAWIRGLTSGIAMIVMGLEGLKVLKTQKLRFWNQRPFTQIIQSYKHFMNASQYIEINILEGVGCSRPEAESLIKSSWNLHRKLETG